MSLKQIPSVSIINKCCTCASKLKKKNKNKRVFCLLKLVEEFDELIFLLLRRYCFIPNGTLSLIAKKNNEHFDYNA